jgi:hypothetical protein
MHVTANVGPKDPIRPRRRNGGAKDTYERALFAEFLRHRDVSSLAGAIARRLGGGVRQADLIAGAGLESNEKRGEGLR